MKLTESKLREIIQEEIKSLNEAKNPEIKTFLDVVEYMDGLDSDMNVKSTKNGFTYEDLDDETITVVVKGKKASIEGGEQNMNLDAFVELVAGGWAHLEA